MTYGATNTAAVVPGTCPEQELELAPIELAPIEDHGWKEGKNFRKPLPRTEPQNYLGFVRRDDPLTQAELAAVDLSGNFALEQQNARGVL